MPTSLPDWSIRVGSITLSEATQVLIHSVSPLGVKSKADDLDRDGGSGVWQGTDWAASRVLTIKAHVVTGAQTPVYQIRYLLGKWNSVGVSSDQVFEMKLPGLPELQTVGRCRYNAGMDAAQFGRSAIEIELQFEDRRGYLSSTTPWSVTGTPSTVASGAAWPWEWPVDFGGVATNVLNIWNAGDLPAPATVRFNGPATNPRVTNPATGKFCGFSGTIPAGEWVEFDPDLATVRDSSGTSRLGEMLSGSSWLYMSRGATTLTYTAGGGTTGQVVVSGRHPYAL